VSIGETDTIVWIELTAQQSLLLTDSFAGSNVSAVCYQLSGNGIEPKSACDDWDGSRDGRTAYYNVPAGDYQVTVTAWPAGSDPVTTSSSVTVTGGAPAQLSVTFTPRTDAALTITLTDENAHPIIGQCFIAGPNNEGYACDDMDGVLDGVSSHYGISGAVTIEQVFAPYGYAKIDPLPVVLTTPTSLDLVNVALTPSIIIHAEDSTGRPVTNLCYGVDNYSAGFGCDMSDRVNDGTTSIYDVAPGGHTVQVSLFGYEQPADQIVTTIDGQPVELTLVLTPIPGPLGVTVESTDGLGNPAPGACFALVGPTVGYRTACDGEDGSADGTTVVRDPFIPMPDGNYSLVETRAPDGLIRAQSRAVVISGNLPLTISITHQNTEAGSNVEVVDAESGVSLTFANVTQPGTTTVTVTTEAPALPEGFSLDSALFFDIHTTAIFEGAVELCLPYNPANFADPSALKLLHFDGVAWIDVTTTNDVSGTICGSVTSFSAFAMAETTVPLMTISGFYSPVDMNGVVNTVKGGSTVPLKFEVYQDGVELTDTAVIASFTVSKTNCELGADEAVIESTTTGNTSLKYAGGQFHQNWKTPKTKGCYKVVVTTVDGTSLEALFKLK
jgi:hypothetical protein